MYIMASKKREDFNFAATINLNKICLSLVFGEFMPGKNIAKQVRNDLKPSADSRNDWVHRYVSH